jgi:hypothetical protein
MPRPSKLSELQEKCLKYAILDAIYYNECKDVKAVSNYYSGMLNPQQIQYYMNKFRLYFKEPYTDNFNEFYEYEIKMGILDQLDYGNCDHTINGVSKTMEGLPTTLTEDDAIAYCDKFNIFDAEEGKPHCTDKETLAEYDEWQKYHENSFIHGDKTLITTIIYWNQKHPYDNYQRIINYAKEHPEVKTIGDIPAPYGV